MHRGIKLVLALWGSKCTRKRKESHGSGRSGAGPEVNEPKKGELLLLGVGSARKSAISEKLTFLISKAGAAKRNRKRSSWKRHMFVALL